MIRLYVFAAACAAALAGAVGCGPARFVDGVRAVAEREGVASADTLSVAEHGHLRFDATLQSDLDDVLAMSEVQDIRGKGDEIFKSAHALAVRGVDSELERMPPSGLDELARRYRLIAPEDVDAKRQFMKQAFADASSQRLDADLQRLSSAKTATDAARFLREIRSAIEPAPGDRGKVGRALLGAPLFLPAAIGAEMADVEATQRAIVAEFKEVVSYTPPDASASPSADQLKAADAGQLASWYAPIIVQQIDPESTYPAEDDRIGRVRLAGTPKSVVVNIDTTQPVVYWAVQQAKVGNHRDEQLVYVAWYPARPALADNDPQAGRIDGVVVRVTLDHLRRPAIYEFVRSCGCYHTLWVAEFVEAAARKEFGKPAEDRRYAVERTDVKRELFLPELVRDDGTHPHRPLAFVSAGYHLLMGVETSGRQPLSAREASTVNYQLEPYDTLTHLPLDGGVASMFGSDGLVHDAGRREGWLLAPTGMLSAGQPRQLGTMKIRMDAYDYDDPRLLERNLRLPSDF